MSTTIAPPKTTTFGKIVDKLMSFDRWGLVLGMILQLGVLLGMIGMRLVILWTGQTCYVRVQPVDPRDWLRGDYVILSYEFSRLPQDGRFDGGMRDGRGNGRDLHGETVFVSLVPEGDGKHWRAARFSSKEPDHGPYLRGKVDNFGRITYGIESFFVQEGEGRMYENAVRSGQLTAEIVVKSDGQAALRKLHIQPK